MGKRALAQSSGSATETVAKQSTAANRKNKKVEKGRIYINASYNNTMVSATDDRGNLLAWASAGGLGFSGPKKATPFASSKVVATVAEKVKPMGLSTVEVFVSGVGGGRDSALRSLSNHGFNILSFKDVTPIPHNGPKPPKARRV